MVEVHINGMQSTRTCSSIGVYVPFPLVRCSVSLFVDISVEYIHHYRTILLTYASIQYSNYGDIV